MDRNDIAGRIIDNAKVLPGEFEVSRLHKHRGDTNYVKQTKGENRSMFRDPGFPMHRNDATGVKLVKRGFRYLAA